MRGELDDALNRMARMEELQRRRAAEAAPDDRSPVDEVIEAVRRVVAQHPTLRVALWAEDGAAGAGVRVEWSDGGLVVQPNDESDGPPPVAALPIAALPSAGGPPESWPVPVPTVTSWSGTPESDTKESAARLAELIRQDPSLLHAANDPHPPE